MSVSESVPKLVSTFFYHFKSSHCKWHSIVISAHITSRLCVGSVGYICPRWLHVYLKGCTQCPVQGKQTQKWVHTPCSSQWPNAVVSQSGQSVSTLRDAGSFWWSISHLSRFSSCRQDAGAIDQTAGDVCRWLVDYAPKEWLKGRWCVLWSWAQGQKKMGEVRVNTSTMYNKLFMDISIRELYHTMVL